MTFDASAAYEWGPAFLADGGILVERIDDQGLAQLLVAPADASAPGRLIGTTYDFRHRLDWALSPDRREVLLVPDNAPSQLITIDTGATRDTNLALPDAGSWQRLAP